MAFIFILNIDTIAQEPFRDVADSLNINHGFGYGTSGGGVSFYDFDHDGWDDLTFATEAGQPIQFYKNNQGNFERVYPIENLFETKQVLWVDYDNDGDADLFVTSFSKNLLYENNGQFVFEDVTEKVKLPMSEETTHGAMWGDYNRDGWLDLYVTDRKIGTDFKNVSNHMYMSIGGEYFMDVSVRTNTADSAKAPFCSAFLDINNNGWQDIYTAQDRYLKNTLLKNLGNETYSHLGAMSNTNLAMNAMCVAVGDYNNDEWQDIYVSNSPEGNALFKNNGDETFTEVASESGVGFYQIGWSSSFFDYDNDGLLDLYACSMNGKNQLYRNIDKINFESINSTGLKKDTVTSFSNAVGEINNDGYPDFVVNNANIFKSTLWLNSGDFGNNWIKISLEGIYSNRDGIGTRIVAYCGDDKYSRYTHCGIGYLAQNSQHELIGINKHTNIDSLKIYWPSGLVDQFYNPPINAKLSIVEGQKSVFNPKLSINGIVELCENDTILINCNIFSNRLKYHWSSGDNSAISKIYQQGVYYLDLEDLQGSLYRSDTVEVVMIDSPEISSVINDISCNNQEDGSVQIEITGGHPPYMISWNNNSNGLKIENLKFGDYKVEVIDDIGCFTNQTFTLKNPEPINVITTVESDLNNNSTGSIKLLVNGGTPPYYYLWKDFQFDNTAEINNLSAGVYDVIVLDNNECEKYVKIEVKKTIILGVENSIIETSVYPNPASNFILIEDNHSTDNNVILIDLYGKIWFKSNFKKSIKIDLLNQPNGIYLLKVNDKTSKIIVSH